MWSPRCGQYSLPNIPHLADTVQAVLVSHTGIQGPVLYSVDEVVLSFRQSSCTLLQGETLMILSLDSTTCMLEDHLGL